LGTMASTGPATAKGDEVLVIARKHPTKKGAYIANAYEGLFSSRGGPTYKDAVDEARKATDMLAEPMKSLKAKEANDRTMAAMLLVMGYTTSSPGTKSEAVPAAESKLILETLAEANWAMRLPLSQQDAFNRLGEKEGWTAPKDYMQFPAEAKKWLKANAGKH